MNGEIPGTTTGSGRVVFSGNNNTIKFSSTNTNERAIIKLKGGVKYITFENLILDATTGTYGIGFQLTNDASQIEISKCTIQCSMTSSVVGNTAGIVLGGSDTNPTELTSSSCRGITINRNSISGGYYGIVVSSDFNNGVNVFNTIQYNNIKDFYSYGIYVNGSLRTYLWNNKISRPTRASLGTFYGIYFTGYNTECDISNNRIFAPFKAAVTSFNSFYGISTDNVTCGSNAINEFNNNLIYDIESAGLQYGIYCNNTDYSRFYHNTISLDDVASTSTSGTRGFYQSGTNTLLYLYNNLITIRRGGTGIKHCIYLTLKPIRINNNNYYISSTQGNNYIGYYNGNLLYLANWKAALYQTGNFEDNDAISVNPFFLAPLPANDSSDYAPTNAIMDNKGLSYILTTDILGNTRNYKPDIGCYEFTSTPCIPTSLNGITDININGKSIITDTTVCEGTAIMLNVNSSTGYGLSQTFTWERTRDTLQGAQFSLPTISHPDTTINAFINNLNDTVFYYRCKLSCSGIDFFTNWRKVKVLPAMPAATYTINSNVVTNYINGFPGGNFISFNAANNTLKQCGVKGNGNLIFNVVPLTGPYFEQLKIDSIAGVKIDNQIIFKGNGNTIAFATSTTPTNLERAVIKLNKADFITFDSIVIDARAGASYGYGVQLINNADSNTFKKCTILTDTSSSNPNFAGIVINASDLATTALGNTLCDGNSFVQNNIIGGYHGITVVGSTTQQNFIKNNTFKNNTISDFYYTGIYVSGTDGTVIHNNSIARPNRKTLATGYGINFFGAASLNATVSNNRISNFYGASLSATTGMFGISFNAADALAGYENKVFNNVIYNTNGAGMITGLINSSSDYVLYYHNTVSIDSNSIPPTSSSYGFNVTGTTAGVHFVNNIIAVSRNGAFNKFAINVGTIANALPIYFNNNNYHIPSYITNGYIASIGGTSIKKTLAQWQNTNSPKFDSSSYDYDPFFINATTGNLKPQFYLLDNKGVDLNITTDILGKTRNNTSPDIGAYEFDSVPCPNNLIAGTATISTATGTCLGLPISLNLTGNSPLGSINFQWQDSIAGGIWRNLGALRYAPQYDTITTTRNFYRCIVTCATTGASTISTLVSKDISGSMPAGVYTIDSATPTNYTGVAGQNFHTFTEAITAMQCGIKGSVLFKVKKGTYNEQIRIPNIAGSSATSTITFQSVNGIASGAIINFTTGSNIATIKFDSTQYVTFQNLTINNNTSTSGRVIELAGTSSNINILNCLINATKYQTASLNNAAIYASDFKGSNLIIRGNTIKNGSFGIYLAGTAGNLAKAGHIIDSNRIAGTYSNGIFVQYIDRIVVKNNILNFTDTAINNVACIYSNYCDSGFALLNNKITIDNNLYGAIGIQVQNSRNRIKTGFGTIANNEVYASSNNIGKVVGLSIAASDSLIVKNNVVSISTGAANSIGLINTNNALGSTLYYFNNSIQIAIVDTNSIAAQITQLNTGNFVFKNNIFSNLGGGKAMFVNSASNVVSDFNLIYTNGKNFANTGTLAANYYQDINKWRASTGLDKNSLVYKPSFISNADLRPNVTDSNCWAMNGRGIQIKGNNQDINGSYRPDSLTAGVPDMGAYEFTTTTLPPNCNAIPATPTANTQQVFYLGCDTVIRVKWGATPPATCSVKRFSGVLPPNQNLSIRKDSMYFYTQMQVPNGYNVPSDIQLNYLENWLGNIPKISSEQQLGLGKTNINNIWNVGFSSKNDINTRNISEANNIYYDKFTGLTNPFTPPTINSIDTTNAGREFWVSYPANQLMGAETFKLYFGAKQASNVTVEIPSINYKKIYSVAANTILTSDSVQQTIRHDNSGKFNDAIKITSDNPIVVYAHIYGVASSAAALLLPISAWGYNYKMLSYHQNWGTGSYSFFNVIANNNNTKIAVRSVDTISGLPLTFDTTLNKGEWLQVIAGNTNADLSGSTIRSIANSYGKCYPIAVFSGDTRTSNSIPCSGGGDFMLQQNLPSYFWGKTYLTAPTSISTSATTFNKNLFRISLQDANQNVYVNGTQIYPTGTPPSCVENFSIASVLSPNTTVPAYIQFTSICANYITSNKPMQVAQFLGGACVGDGDPELMYLTPIENGVTNTSLYRTNMQSIGVNYLTIIGNKKDTPTICEGNPCINLTWSHIYPHPNYPSNNVYIKYWSTATPKQVNITSNYSFTGITYGLGSVESYGYNIGMNLAKLTQPIISGVDTNKCSGKNITFSYTVPINIDSLAINLSTLKGITPSQNILLKAPFTATPPTLIVSNNGDSLWKFTLPGNYKIDSTGYQSYQVKAYKSSFESCDNTLTLTQGITIYPTPKINTINSNSPVITGSTINLNVNVDNPNDYNYSWSGVNAFTSSTQNPTITNANNLNAGTYKVVVSNGVCSATDSTTVVINAGGSLSISGKCTTPLKKAINNVKVDIKNGIQNTQYSILGNYQFTFLPSNLSYAIRPTKNNDIAKANGVTSVDVLLTQRHILNTAKLNSPYKLIAADVDGNKAINSVDVLRMKRLILGTDTTFTKTVGTVKTDRLWEFVDSAYQFPDTTNPFPFKDSIAFTNLTSNKTNQTFIGVKLGDVNYDWSATVAKQLPVNSVQLVYHVISTKEKSTQTDFSGSNLRNDELLLPVTVNNFKDLAAMQYTLHFDNTKYEFVGIENNKLGIDFNATQANKTGNIAMLWTDKNAQPKTLEDGTELFTLVLRSTVNSQLLTDATLVLTNDIAEVEAWDNDYRKHNIVLTQKVSTKDQEPKTTKQLVIYPNPTNGIVNIECDNARKIVMMDCLGRRIKEYNNPTQLFTINCKLLSKGIYIVQVTMQDGTMRSEKLVVE